MTKPTYKNAITEAQEALMGACKALELSPERSLCVQSLAKLDALIEAVPVEPKKVSEVTYSYVNALHEYLCISAEILHEATGGQQ